MGLLEESIPEQYICYVCRDPPGKPPPHAGGKAPKDLVMDSVMCPLYKNTMTSSSVQFCLHVKILKHFSLLVTILFSMLVT